MLIAVVGVALVTWVLLSSRRYGVPVLLSSGRYWVPEPWCLAPVAGPSGSATSLALLPSVALLLPGMAAAAGGRMVVALRAVETHAVFTKGFIVHCTL